MPESSFQRADSTRPCTVAIIGGGFSGTLFALKLASQQPEWSILLVEERKRIGCGVAYGACAAEHLLNVSVNRMEIGLTPSFTDWLAPRQDELCDALDESDGRLADAFVPRHLFGQYLEERVLSAMSFGSIRHVQGKAIGLRALPRQMSLVGGRTFPVNIAVLATGNLPSSFPARTRGSKRIIADPWIPGALDGIAADAALLLVGSGLTMVDTVLSLQARGHRGPIDVLSRHGLLPRAHKAGGSWPPFMKAGASPREALRAIRAAVGDAVAKGVPWQRVFDAVRPSVPLLWQGWDLDQRAQFLRHLRTIWDVHRHRMAARKARDIQHLIDGGVVRIHAGKVLALDEHRDGVTAVVRPKGNGVVSLEVAATINCTGPGTDLRETSDPLLRQLLADGLILPDPLGLGLESEDGAVRDAKGDLSEWLFALGPLERPAWWEITAVPEINAQIDRLVRTLTHRENGLPSRTLPEVFLDLGAGI